MTTGVVRVPAGNWQVSWLAIPRGKAPGHLTIVVCDERGTPVATIASGPLQTKRLDVWTTTAAADSDVSFKVVAVDVLWGLWVQVK